MSKPLERLKLMIREAQLGTRDKGSTGTLAAIVTSQNGETIRQDPELFNYMLQTALNIVIRGAIKVQDEDHKPNQMSFPLSVMPLVKMIGRDAVFVPSRSSFADITPEDMTPDEMDEAGDYLIEKGEESITRGRLLKRLAADLRKQAVAVA